MFSIIGALLFGVLAVFTLLAGLGLPLGEFTMGGKHRVLPPKMRVAACSLRLIWRLTRS